MFLQGKSLYSHFGHETAYLRLITSCGMCEAWPPWIPGDYIPFLWHLHLVRFALPRERDFSQSISRSQTSWIWLETKLVELGMIGSTRNYQVFFSPAVMVARLLTLTPDFIWYHHPLYFSYGWLRISSPRQDLHVHRLYRTKWSAIRSPSQSTPNHLESLPPIVGISQTE